MSIGKYILRKDDWSPKKKESFLRVNIVVLPLLIISVVLVALESAILSLVLLTKFRTLKEFSENFYKISCNFIGMPLFLAIMGWVMYGALIYPREVRANMSMTSSADIKNGLRNVISTEYLKDKNLIVQQDKNAVDGDIMVTDGSGIMRKGKETEFEALVRTCFNEKRIAELFKYLVYKEKDEAKAKKIEVDIREIELCAGLSKELREKLELKLKRISKCGALRENYCAFDTYQLAFRIAYIFRNQEKLGFKFNIEDIFNEEWLKKLNEKEGGKSKNEIKNDNFKEYFFKKIRANDKNKIEEKYENAKGAGNNIMTGGQIMKYFAKLARLIIVTFVFGQIYKFLEKTFDFMKDLDLNFVKDLLNSKCTSDTIIKFLEFLICMAVFAILYLSFEKYVNKETQYHAISIVQKLNTDPGYIFGVNEKENQQLVMDPKPKDNMGEERVLKFDSNDDSLISYRIMLNLAISPLLENGVKDEFFLSS